MTERLTTSVSPAHWCTADGSFEPAVIPPLRNRAGGTGDVSWMDQLLEGGLVLPDPPKRGHRALTLLITGPPGSGKSTLALELCHRWTEPPRAEGAGADGDTAEGLATLYITSETSFEWARQKARSFGWPNRITGYTKSRLSVPLIRVWQTTDFEKYLEDRDDLPELAAAILDGIKLLYTELPNPTPLAARIRDLWRRVALAPRLRGPHVVVIDSLNTLDPAHRPRVFDNFMKLASAGPRILVIILESDGQSSPKQWEYVADVVLRLDRRRVSDSDYLVRTIEIVKARYQSHVWGKHQLKIYSRSRGERLSARLRRRDHPYRDEGGIFIFPSIHYYLSVYKRKSPDLLPEPVQTPLPSLDRLLKGGFPKGRCVGFIGHRGGHKSHLAYLCALDQVLTKGRKALIVSLRDDEGIATKTLTGILADELKGSEELARLEREDRIELLYYPPGYITPEEFFHRMYMSLQRLRSRGGEGQEVVVVFNSLDQLSSRFPLCAREQIFIPGLIETLSAENVSSFFIAVAEPGQPPEQYGLLSMADVLISFTQEPMARRDYLGHLSEYLGLAPDDPGVTGIREMIPAERQIVTLRVVRFAGGQAAGGGGILELVDDGSPEKELLARTGLQLVPFSPKYSHRSSAESSLGVGTT